MSVTEADVGARQEPGSKKELLDEMERARAELDRAIAAIPRDAFEKPRTWGEWTLKDLVAHIAAYERWTSEQMEIVDPPQELRDSVSGDATGGVDALNQMIYEAHREDPLDEVLVESRTAYELLRGSIERKTDDGLARPAWFSGPGTLLAFVPEQSYGHYRDHLADLIAAGRAGRSL